MSNFIGIIIKSLFNLIGNYAIVLILIGIVVTLLQLYPQILKLLAYKKRIDLNPKVEEIKAMNLPKNEEEEKIGELFINNNYNPILSSIPTFIIGIVTFLIFLVMIRPYQYIGLPDDYTQSFLYYDNIFEKSSDFIIPIIVILLRTISPILGKPIHLIDKKQILTNFLITSFTVIIFANVTFHVYIIYCLGLSIGSFLVNLILMIPRRILFNKNENLKAGE